MLTEDQAKLCEATNPTSCICQQVLTECLFGPDSRGNLVRTKITHAEAHACDKASCTCEYHGKDEFLALSEERESSAYDRIEKAQEQAQQEEEAYLAAKEAAEKEDSADETEDETGEETDNETSDEESSEKSDEEEGTE